YSLYDSWIFDRKLAGAFSLKAAYYWIIEWIALSSADKVLCDTNEHVKYFVRTFGIMEKKFSRALVGTDDFVFYPRHKTGGGKFTVHFHGHFIPLQGVEHILKAASILKGKGVYFRLIGKGQEYRKARSLAQDLKLANVDWIDKVSYSELPEYISKSDVSLGIFGDTGKAGRVIPNKVYEAAAVK